jgi:hypothetical protein
MSPPEKVSLVFHLLWNGGMVLRYANRQFAIFWLMSLFSSFIARILFLKVWMNRSANPFVAG